MAALLRVGLTGGIACGKTRVLSRLGAAGHHVLDLDVVGHQLMAPGGPAHQPVLEAFGTDILAVDGTIDRKRLGASVFSDSRARARLGAILHPLIRREEQRRALSLGADVGGVLVTDAALLVETGQHLRYDRLIVVHTSPALQLARLRARDGLDEKAAAARIAAQMPATDKASFAHYPIDTSASLADTDAAADRVATELRELAAAPHPPLLVSADRVAACLACGAVRGPAGLSPVGLLSEIVAARGLDLVRIAKRVHPARQAPWYAPPEADGTSPESLAPALALWALARRGADEEFVAWSAVSLARITQTEAASRARLCLAALIAAGVCARGLDARLLEHLPRWGRLAKRWAGADAGQDISAALGAAVMGGDVAGTRALAAQTDGASDLAAALTALSSGRISRDPDGPSLRIANAFSQTADWS